MVPGDSPFCPLLFLNPRYTLKWLMSCPFGKAGLGVLHDPRIARWV